MCAKAPWCMRRDSSGLQCGAVENSRHFAQGCPCVIKLTEFLVFHRSWFPKTARCPRRAGSKLGEHVFDGAQVVPTCGRQHSRVNSRNARRFSTKYRPCSVRVRDASFLTQALGVSTNRWMFQRRLGSASPCAGWSSSATLAPRGPGETSRRRPSMPQ